MREFEDRLEDVAEPVFVRYGAIKVHMHGNDNSAVLGMLPLDDPKWQSYKGGYRAVYDASKSLRLLLADGGSPELWTELWNELHHQGDVDEASYASVLWLVDFVRRAAKLDWNPLALIAVIELERPKNPAVPAELSEAYFDAIRALPAVLGTHSDQIWDELVLQGATACIALARGQRWFGRAYLELDRDTAVRWFSEEFGWEFGNT